MVRTSSALILRSTDPEPPTAGSFGVTLWATGWLVGLRKLGRSVAAMNSYTNPRRIEGLVWSDRELGGVAKFEPIVS